MKRDNNKIHIKSPKIEVGKTIKEPNIILEGNSYDSYKPAFSFEHAQGNYCLSNWHKKDIKKLIEKFKIFESKTWNEMKHDNVLRMGLVDKKGLKKVRIPQALTPDVNIYYLKPFGQNTPQRIFGFKERHNFKFLWFDNNHEIYPGS